MGLEESFFKVIKSTVLSPHSRNPHSGGIFIEIPICWFSISFQSAVSSFLDDGVAIFAEGVSFLVVTGAGSVGLGCRIRNINNDVTVMRNVNKVGESLDKHKKSKIWSETQETSIDLVVVTDGGHVQDKEEGKHTFEEMVTTVYKPKDVLHKKNGRQEINKKVCVASAKNDRQQSIKKLTKNACKKLGMTEETTITALTDGAKNCWSVVNSLEKSCQEVIKILDWFHIGKKFKERESKIPAELNEIYNKAKWHCWHGHPETSIVRLNQVRKELNNKLAIEKLDELIRYINNNHAYIINYHSRRLKKLPFTSQLAEDSVNSVINERQKNKKMQWTRKGAHNILQIRTSLYSKQWDSDWEKIENEVYKMAA